MTMAVLNGLIGTQVARQQLHRSVDMAAYATEVEAKGAGGNARINTLMKKRERLARIEPSSLPAYTVGLLGFSHDVVGTSTCAYSSSTMYVRQVSSSSLGHSSPEHVYILQTP